MAKDKEVCGHVNKHYTNPQGNKEDLYCDLQKGHAGDHHAACLKNVPEITANERGVPVKTTYHTEETETFWGDMAAIPASEIKAGEVAQLTEYQRDILMEVMKKNPNLNAAQALAAAKLEESWK